MREPEVELLLADSEQPIAAWSAYEFNADYTTPTDGFSFTVQDPRLDADSERALLPGAAVQLRLDGWVQATGYLDAVERSASRDGGVLWRLEGRDVMGQVVDASVDPRFRIKPTESMLDVLLRLLGPFGWSDAEQIWTDASVDITAKTGRAVSAPGVTLPSSLTAFKPNTGEGVFEFTARIAKRYRLQLRASADGRRVLIDRPLYKQPALHTLLRKKHAPQHNNLLEASARLDASEQPSVLIADGFSGGGEFGRSKMRVLLANPAARDAEQELERLSREHKTAKIISPWPDGEPPARWLSFPNPRGRPLYLHDENSKTLAQLEAFARRELMARVRKSLSYSVTVAGHGQYDSSGRFTPWAINTVVDVDDDIAGVHEPMWVLSRTFAKSRAGGTTTRLELIRLHSLEL